MFLTMDMLSPGSGLNLLDKKWPIYARTPSCPPAFVGKFADVCNSVVTKGCRVSGEVKNSVLSYNVTVGRGAHAAALFYSICSIKSTIYQSNYWEMICAPW